MLDFLAKLLGPGALIGIAIGAALMFGWDHRPLHWPNVAVGPCPLCIHVGLPGGGQDAELAESQAAFATERRSFGIVFAALGRQNAAVAAIGAAGVNARARSAAAVSAYASAEKRAFGVEGQLSRVLANTKADPDCDRYWAVNEFISENLR